MVQQEIFAPVIIRRSAFFLLLELLGLEILVLTVFLLLRAPLHFFQVDFIDSVSVYFVYTILFLSLSLFKVVLLFSVILKWMNNYYEITPGELIHRKGIFHTQSTTFSLRNIELQEVNQGFLGKIFKYGTIEIYNPLLKQRFSLVNVPFPHQQLKTIQHSAHSKVDRDIKIVPRVGA